MRTFKIDRKIKFKPARLIGSPGVQWEKFNFRYLLKSYLLFICLLLWVVLRLLHALHYNEILLRHRLCAKPVRISLRFVLVTKQRSIERADIMFFWSIVTCLTTLSRTRGKQNSQYPAGKGVIVAKMLVGRFPVIAGLCSALNTHHSRRIPHGNTGQERFWHTSISSHFLN